MSALQIQQPASLAAVTDQCEHIERWSETCESVAELKDVSNKLAAIDEYLHRTSNEGRGRVAATLRRLEVRIGRLLGKSPGAGPGRGKVHRNEPFSKQQRHGFREMAEHADLVEQLAEQSTDDSPLSRRKVLQAIADAEREIAEEREIATDVREFVEQHRPEDFDPKLNARLIAQRGALMRLCRDITAMDDPDDLIDQQDAYLFQLRNIVPQAVAARSWLDSFIAAMEETS
jgi:hypothetical protein